MVRRAKRAEGGCRVIDVAVTTNDVLPEVTPLAGKRGARGENDARVVEADS